MSRVETEETPLRVEQGMLCLATADCHRQYRLHSAADDSLGPQFPLLKSITESVVLCGCSLNKMADFLWASVIWQVRLVKGYDPVNLFALLAPR